MSDPYEIRGARLVWEVDCSSAPIPKPHWRLVRRFTSFRADVVPRSLRGEELTAWSNAISCRTNSPAATFRALRRDYRWPTHARYVEFLPGAGRQTRIEAYSFNATKVRETMRRSGDKLCPFVEAWRNRASMGDVA